VIAGLRASRSLVGLASWLGVVAVMAWLAPGVARANDFDQFQNARVAYESLNYELAADLFKGLLSTAAAGDTRPVVIESRKYLAAAYLFLGKRPDAEAQLELLLRAVPDYVLDPLAFPEEVGKTFNVVKARLQAERAKADAARAREAATKQGHHELELQQQRARLQRLIELASTERVERRRSRWVAMVPFGIGQFQNDHNGLGLVLAVSEGALLAISVTSFALHESLRGQVPTASRRDDARLAEATFRYTNQISFGLFGALAITGIIDAQLRFVPSRSYEERRPLPRELLELQISVGPGDLAVRGRF
jgi:hypothetical protein